MKKSLQPVIIIGIFIFSVACLMQFIFPGFEWGDLSVRPDNDTPNVINAPEPGNRVSLLAVDSCGLSLIEVAANLEASRVRDNPFTYDLRSGDPVEIQRQLNCIWEEEYQSEYLTDRIYISLQISHLNSEKEAQAMYAETINVLKEDLKYCLEDAKLCAVTTEDFGADRSLYSEGTIYIRGDGTILPSTHIADLAKVINNSGGIFFVRANVTHPEKSEGDTWVLEQITIIDRFTLSLFGE